MSRALDISTVVGVSPALLRSLGVLRLVPLAVLPGRSFGALPVVPLLGVGWASVWAGCLLAAAGVAHSGGVD